MFGKRNNSMSNIKRFGVSLEDDLLKRFDSLIRTLGYGNRSEAIRDLIRNRLVEEEWKDEEAQTVGVLSLVYSHERPDLTETLNNIQHQHLNEIVSSTHIHLDHHNCLEVIILKGSCRIIREISDQILSTRSVKHGQLMQTTTGNHLD